MTWPGEVSQPKRGKYHGWRGKWWYCKDPDPPVLNRHTVEFARQIFKDIAFNPAEFAALLSEWEPLQLAWDTREQYDELKKHTGFPVGR